MTDAANLQAGDSDGAQSWMRLALRSARPMGEPLPWYGAVNELGGKDFWTVGSLSRAHAMIAFEFANANSESCLFSQPPPPPCCARSAKLPTSGWRTLCAALARG